MKDIDRGSGVTMVECDECGYSTHIDSTDFREIISTLRDDGWCFYSKDAEWYDFCCKECKDSFIKGWD